MLTWWPRVVISISTEFSESNYRSFFADDQRLLRKIIWIQISLTTQEVVDKRKIFLLNFISSKPEPNIFDFFIVFNCVVLNENFSGRTKRKTKKKNHTIRIQGKKLRRWLFWAQFTIFCLSTQLWRTCNHKNSCQHQQDTSRKFWNEQTLPELVLAFRN